MLGKILTFKCSLHTIRMDEEGISNIYINDVMEKISRTFHGTFSIDNIPDIDNYAFSIIINLSKQKTKGSHFVAILNQKSNIIYFDSFGDQNINRTLQKYLKNIKNKLYILIFNCNAYSALIMDLLYVIYFVLRK